MSAGNRVVVELLTGRERPMYSSGDPVLWYQRTLSRYLSKYRAGLTQLAKHYGFDKEAEQGQTYFAEGA